MPRALATGVALVILAVATVATAATITGTSRADRLSGTAARDVIDGRAGNDALSGNGGSDFLRGGLGGDTLSGGGGPDRIAVHADDQRDVVVCGAGLDIVNAELGDTVAPDCEIVSRQLSRDTTTSAGAQHATEVEPDSFAWGSTVVAAFQVGRAMTGGAAAIGFATSADAGRTWRSGLLPGLTVSSPLPGLLERVSDPVVAYDALHGVWLIASLGISDGAFELLVSRSQDARTWGPPVSAARGPAGAFDKEWVACDNWSSSPFRGRCYLSYLDGFSRQIETRTSVDGGLTWSAPVPTSAVPPRGTEVNGAQPLPRPDGALVIVYVTFGADGPSFEERLLAARSTDGAASFGAEAQVAVVAASPVAGLRAPHLPSADVDAAGRVYVVWHACRVDEGCAVDQLFLATSDDGLTWSQPVPGPPAPALNDAFVPGLAVDQSPTASPTGPRLALVYHTVPRDCFDSTEPCGVDVWLALSADAGRTWSRQRLNAEAMRLGWIALTNTGRFLGDYVSTSFAGGRAVPVYSLAAEPLRRTFRQAIFAAALPR